MSFLQLGQQSPGVSVPSRRGAPTALSNQRQPTFNFANQARPAPSQPTQPAPAQPAANQQAPARAQPQLTQASAEAILSRQANRYEESPVQYYTDIPANFDLDFPLDVGQDLTNRTIFAIAFRTAKFARDELGSGFLEGYEDPDIAEEVFADIFARFGELKLDPDLSGIFMVSLGRVDRALGELYSYIGGPGGLERRPRQPASTTWLALASFATEAIRATEYYLRQAEGRPLRMIAYPGQTESTAEEVMRTEKWLSPFKPPYLTEFAVDDTCNRWIDWTVAGCRVNARTDQVFRLLRVGVLARAFAGSFLSPRVVYSFGYSRTDGSAWLTAEIPEGALPGFALDAFAAGLPLALVLDPLTNYDNTAAAAREIAEVTIKFSTEAGMRRADKRARLDFGNFDNIKGILTTDLGIDDGTASNAMADLWALMNTAWRAFAAGTKLPIEDLRYNITAEYNAFRADQSAMAIPRDDNEFLA